MRGRGVHVWVHDAMRSAWTLLANPSFNLILLYSENMATAGSAGAEKGGRCMEIVREENPEGGKGFMTLKKLLGEEEMHGNCGLYAEVTMEKGTELGFHRHYGESETYYILSGESDYNDNGTVRPVRAGDVTYTPSGKGHGLTNTGDGEFVFMALIIKD